MSELTEYTIRTMNRHKVDIVVDWAAEEGWNPGLHNAVCFHAADSSGFLVGLLFIIEKSRLATPSESGIKKRHQNHLQQ
jgi:hypothetical protein